MPINFNHLRLQNLFNDPDTRMPMDIFGQGQQPSPIDINSLLQPSMAEQPEMQQPPNDTTNLIQQLYQPRHDFSDRLINTVDEMPTRDQFHPSKWRQFGAVLKGIGGQPGSYDEFKNRPFYQAEGDWKNKIDTLMKGANEEDRYNTNQRLLAQSSGRYELDTAKLDNQKRRTDAYVADKMNPDLQKIVPNSGNIQLYNPKTGETTDTGIDVGRLDDKQKIALRSGAKLEEIKATIEGQTKLEGTKQANRETNIGLTGEEQRKTKQTAGSYAGSPTQEKVGQYNRARQFAIENPDLAKWIQLDSAGPNTFSIHTPSSGNFFSSGPSKEDYDKIVNSITSKRGSAADKQIDTTQGKTDNSATKLTDPKTNQSYDISTWSAKDIAEAKKRGWK